MARRRVLPRRPVLSMYATPEKREVTGSTPVPTTGECLGQVTTAPRDSVLDHLVAPDSNASLATAAHTIRVRIAGLDHVDLRNWSQPHLSTDRTRKRLRCALTKVSLRCRSRAEDQPTPGTAAIPVR